MSIDLERIYGRPGIRPVGQESVSEVTGRSSAASCPFSTIPGPLSGRIIWCISTSKPGIGTSWTPVDTRNQTRQPNYCERTTSACLL